MSYTNVNGSLFRQMVTNGANNLKNDFKEIDELNVFPVPDGDTGTNMSMTMCSGISEIEKLDSDSLKDISKTLSRGFLMGARGNSGVILSQFFRGVSVGMKSLQDSTATINDFIDCLVSGYKVAYQAVMTPVEGTILTVMREAGEHIDSNRGKYNTINELLDDYVKAAEISLANTPNILPVLKEAHVVDSGAAGFVKVIIGMLKASNDEIIEIITEETKKEQIVLDHPEKKFLYEAELTIMLKNKNTFLESDIKGPLSVIGKCDELFTKDDKVIVKLHTNYPGRALSMAQKHGEFENIKIINVKVTPLEEEKPLEKVVVDTPKIKYGIIAVCFGDGIKKTFEQLGVNYIIDGGQTMNPSTESFVKAVNELNAENVIIIPNNSNVIMSANQTKELCEGKKIEVLRTKNICHGFAAMSAFDENQSLEENVTDMTQAISNVSAIEVTYAIRDTNINGVEIKSGDFMGILNDEIIVSTPNRLEAVKTSLKESITEDTGIVTVFVGKDATTEETEAISDYAMYLNNDVDVQVIIGNQDIYSFIISVENF